MFGLFVQAKLFASSFVLVCSAQPSSTATATARSHQTSGALSSISPSHLFVGSACPPLESDWPLALDWNWLNKGYNNERLLIFWLWHWRSVKNGILLSQEQQGSILAYCIVDRSLRSDEAFDPRDTVFLIGLYWSSLLLFMTAQSWWMSACCAESKTEVTIQILPQVQLGCLRDVLVCFNNWNCCRWKILSQFIVS